MKSTRTFLRYFKNLDQNLSSMALQDRPAHFEMSVAQAFSLALNLPFYSSDNDDESIPYRVLWQGKADPIDCAPPGKPDIVIYCYGYCLLIEPTMKTGANQCSQEFPQAIRHYRTFCSDARLSPSSVYVLLVCPRLHGDTFLAIKNHRRTEIVVPVQVSEVAGILQTSILAFTLSHPHLRGFLHAIMDCVRNASRTKDFYDAVGKATAEWQAEVLKQEISPFVGVKSYQAMRKKNRSHVSVGEVLPILQKDPVVRQYFKLIHEKIGPDTIGESLIQQGLGCRLSATLQGDEIFEPIPVEDYKARTSKLVHKVAGAG